MKLFKKGMTLAEILITLGIVSVIATIGFTFAKKGIQNAYDMYLYTGYKALHSAFAEARYKGESLPASFTEEPCKAPFIETLTDLLSADCKDTDRYSATLNFLFKINPGVSLTAPNNIEFNIFKSTLNPAIYIIDILVPSEKISYTNFLGQTDIKDKRYHRFFYDPNMSNFIIPSSYVSDFDFMSERDLYRFVQDRQDLLPFYIDDGEVGRVIPNNDDYKYKPIKPLSFREAFCSMKDSKWYGKDDTPQIGSPLGVDIDCDEYSDQNQKGILKLYNPNKL